MAWLMITDVRIKRFVRLRQLTSQIQPKEILADVHRIRGNELGIQVFGELDVFMVQHQRGRRLGTDNDIAITDGICQYVADSPLPDRGRNPHRRR